MLPAQPVIRVGGDGASGDGILFKSIYFFRIFLL